MNPLPFRLFVAGLLVAGGVAPAVAENGGATLAKEVTIRRTAYGVPHILAQNERAAGFGMGYVQAEDHLLNIMRSIIRARGELAKYFGGEDNVKMDFWNRQFRIYSRAVETYHRLDPDWRDMTEGFAEGLNYYMDLHRSDLPPWVQPVSGHDIAAHGLTGVARFAFNRRRVVDRFVRRLENGEDALALPEDMGSNVWAFSPGRTKSGHAILMGNPHQPWSPVATYFEAHITIPGTVNFYGSTFVGRPVMTTGFNENLGWSHTVNYPDLEEIYELAMDPNTSDHYLFDGGSVALREEVAVVQVKTDGGFREERRSFWYSPLGPVIHRTPTHAYVLRSAAYDEFRFYQQWYRLEQAHNFEEYREALRIMAIPMFNIGYADRDGNIYYLWNGTIPDLPHAAHDTVAVRASKTSDIWTRFLGLDDLPQLLNPIGGYVANSNSTPYLTNLRAPMARDSFPPYFPENRMSLRSQHSLQMIDTDAKLSLEDIVEMKHTMHVLLPDRVKQDLIRAVRLHGRQGEEQQAADLIDAWQNDVTKTSQGSVLFEAWWLAYSKDHEAQENFAYVWDENDPVATPRGLADPQRAARAFSSAMTDVKKRYGAWDVPWGDVHRIRFGDLDLPVGGSGHHMGAFRVVSYKEASDGKQIAHSGDSWYFAVEFGQTPKAYTLVAYSQSEIEGRPHFSDQAPLFANRKMKRAAFTEAEIARQLIAQYHPGEED